MFEPLPEEIDAALRATEGARGRFGAPCLFAFETPSTNDLAARMADRGAPQGAMALTLSQTAGRGRLGRTWFSPPGAGLYVSLVLRSARIAPVLTLAGGVAVASGVRHATGLPVQLEWPNDVVIPDAFAPGRRRKLAGILAEGATGPDGLQYVVLGFGINLRNALYPPEIANIATSLEAELGRDVDAGTILAAVLVALNEQVTAAEAGDTQVVLDRWRALAPAAVGECIEWTADGVTRRGTTAGIDHRGALLARIGGRTERIISGAVAWVRD